MRFAPRRTCSIAGAALVLVAGLQGTAAAFVVDTLRIAAGIYDEGRMGTSLARIGDFDGDGVEDHAASMAGTVLVYLGGGQGSSPDLVIVRFDVGGFGASIAAAGDFNGDGYADLVVGAPFARGDAGFNAGRLFFYYGGPGFDSLADHEVQGAQSDGRLGAVLAGGGDINGDGYDDVLASSHQADPLVRGRVQVFHGAPSPASSPGLVLEGGGTDRLGVALAIPGDLDNDGVDDYLVGASTAGDSGRVRLYRGGAVAAPEAFRIISGNPFERLGSHLAAAGDFNDDGYPDFVAGAAGIGKSRIYAGGPDPGAELVVTVLGYPVVAAGDINADGGLDLLARRRPNVEVIFGGASADSVADGVIAGLAGSDIGAALAGAGDLDGNGIDDFVVTDPWYSTDSCTRCGALLFLTLRGHNLIAPSAGARWIAGAPYAVSWMGSSPVDLSFSSDSGMTWTSLAQGAGGSTINVVTVVPPGPASARALLRLEPTEPLGPLLGPITIPLVIAEVELVAPSSNETWYPGEPHTAVWTGSTPVDLEVSADDATWRVLAGAVGGQADNSLALVPPPDLRGRLKFRARSSGKPATPLTSQEAAGWIHAHAFKVAASPLPDPWHEGQSHVVRWLGSTPADVEVGLETSPGSWRLIAGPVGGAADNAVEVSMPAGLSGTARLRIRASGEAADSLNSEVSRPFLACGAVSWVRPRTEMRMSAEGTTIGTQLGASLVPCGDIDGDGRADFGVGAPGAGATRAGELRLYLSGSGQGNGPHLVLGGTRPSERFGSIVAGLGDINGDGFDDVGVGASTYNSRNGATTWSVQVFLGGPELDQTPDWVLEPTEHGISTFGAALGPIGDYNGDGFDDFAVTTTSFTTGTIRVHWLEVHLGAPTAQGVQVLPLNLTANPNELGFSLAPAGDVDGDGRDDLAAGAPKGPGEVFVFGFPGRLLRRWTSAAPGARFGHSIALVRGATPAENVLAVGAPLSVAGGTYAGEVHLYSTQGQPRGSLVGTPYLEWGSALDASGDLDGDGLSDLAVGCPGSTFQRGEVHVFAGSGIASLCTRHELASWKSAQSGSRFGAALALVSRADGPLAEVLIGAPDHVAGTQREGRLEIHRVVRPRLAGLRPGHTVYAGERDTLRWSGADRVDLALSLDDGASWTTLLRDLGGAPENQITWTVPATPTLRARARLSRSGEPPYGANQDLTRSFRIASRRPVSRAARREVVAAAGAAARDREGTRLAWMPDVDGDAVAEFLSAAPEAGGGRVTLHLSGGGTRTWSGEAPGDRFGESLVATHDLDGDGLADLVVGAPGHGTAGPRAGRVYVYAGGPRMGNSPLRVIDGLQAGEEAGAALAAVADLQHVGAASLAVGAPGHNAESGAVRVYLTDPAFDGEPDVVLEGVQPGARFGAALADAGDLDANGRSDLAIGAPLHDGIAENAGRVAVYRSPLGATPLVLVGLEGSKPYEGMGSTVAGGGDLDADGHDDLAIGSPGFTGGYADAGRVALLFGGPRMDPAAAMSIEGRAPGARLGTSVAIPGDMNGDGVADLAAGAPFMGPADAGAVQLHHGQPRMSHEPDVIVNGRPGDRLGLALAPAGDPRGAGFHDLLAGAPFADGVSADQGRVDRIDMNRYFLVKPNGGERWQAGTAQVIEWIGEEPAEIQLSMDGGRTYRLLAEAQVRTRATVRVPLEASSRARVRVVPADRSVRGSDESDGDFEVRSAIRLVSFESEVEPDGVHLRWESDPPPGPDGIRGYRLLRSVPGAAERRASLFQSITTSTRFVDRDAGPGVEYALQAMDASGEVIELGRLTVAGIDGLRLGPVPYRGQGPLAMSFEAPVDGSGATAADLSVRLYDAAGRQVALLAQGPLEARARIVERQWDGRLPSGARAAPGVYFVRAEAPSAGFRLTRRLVIVH